MIGKETADRVMEMFSEDMIYLNRGLTISDLAGAAGADIVTLKSEFDSVFGYSFKEMVIIWRLCHASDLLRKRVPYSLIWKLSGFKSLKEMEREWNRLVY